MGKHRISLGRRGVAALAAAGALVIGGTTASMIGTGTAAPLDILAASSPTNTIVLPDLAPFKAYDVRGAGKGEVSDEVGAPIGGGEAALRLSTPTTSDKASYIAPVSGAATSLDAWIPTAAYSAYQIKADNPIQFPSLQLTVDYDGGDATTGFSTLTYEPVYNAGDSTTAGQWNRYQAGMGKWCSTRAIPGVITEAQRSCSNGGDKPLTDYVAAAPDLVVTGVVINQGSGNAGLESAVDLITTPTATYDFELTKPVVVVPPVDTTTTTPPTTKPGNGNGGNNGGGNNGGGNNGGWGENGNGGNNGNHPGNGNNGGWGENGHCGC